MKIGDRVQFKGRTGKIVAFMPGEMVDVQFDDVKHIERRAKSLLTVTSAKANPAVRLNPRYMRAPRRLSSRRNPAARRNASAKIIDIDAILQKPISDEVLAKRLQDILATAAIAAGINPLSVYYNTYSIHTRKDLLNLDPWSEAVSSLGLVDYDWADLASRVSQKLGTGLTLTRIADELADVDRTALDFLVRQARPLIYGFQIRDAFTREAFPAVPEVELSITEQDIQELQAGIIAATKRRKEREAKGRKTTFRPKKLVTREPRSALDEIIRKTKAAWFTRHDPLRPAGDIKTCGNPIDGTAYYIVVDADRKNYARYLTWEDTRKNVTTGTRGAVEVLYPGALDILARLKVPVVFDEEAGVVPRQTTVGGRAVETRGKEQPIEQKTWLESRWPEDTLRYATLIGAPVATKKEVKASNYVTLTEDGRAALIKEVVDVFPQESENIIAFLLPLRSSGMSEGDLRQYHIRRGDQWFDTVYNNYVLRFGLATVTDLSSDPILALTPKGSEGIQTGIYPTELSSLLVRIPKDGIHKSVLVKTLQDENLEINLATLPKLLEQAKLEGAVVETFASEIEKIARVIPRRPVRQAQAPEIRWAQAEEVETPSKIYRKYYQSKIESLDTLLRTVTDYPEDEIDRIRRFSETDQRRILAFGATKKRFGLKSAEEAEDIFKSDPFVGFTSTSDIPLNVKISPLDYYAHIYTQPPSAWDRLLTLNAGYSAEKRQRILSLSDDTRKREIVAGRLTTRRFDRKSAKEAAEKYKKIQSSNRILPKPGDVVETRISRVLLKDRAKALSQIATFTTGEYGLRLMEDEYQDLYDLKYLSEKWGNQTDIDGGFQTSTTEILANYRTEKLLAEKFYAECRALEQKVSTCVVARVKEGITKNVLEFVQPAGKDKKNQELFYTWDNSRLGELRNLVAELHRLYGAALSLDERFAAPFTPGQVGEIFAPLRRIFSALSLTGLFQENLKMFEANAALFEKKRAEQRATRSPSTRRVPRLAQGIDPDRLEKLLDACLVDGEQKAYPVTQVSVGMDPNGKGKAIDAEPSKHFYIQDGDKKVFFRIERRLYPGYSFIDSLNPYTFRQFRAIRTDDDVAQLLVDSAHEAGTEISLDLARMFIGCGMVSVNPNVKGKEDDYVPVEYIYDLTYPILKNQTLRIYNRYKAYSSFFTWQPVEGPEAILDTQVPTTQAIVPCVDPVDAIVIRTMGYFRNILYGIQEVFSTIRSIVSNAMQGEGGKITGSELQLDTLVRKFLRTLEFYASVVQRLQVDIEASSQYTYEDQNDRERAARKALSIIENTIEQYDLKDIFNMADRTDLFSSGRGVAKARADEDRIRGYKRQRQYKPRKADTGAKPDVLEQDSVISLQQAILRKVISGFSELFPPKTGANVKVKQPANNLILKQCPNGAYLKPMPDTTDWPSFAQTVSDFLLRMILKSQNIDTKDDSNAMYKTAAAMTYTMVNDLFDAEGKVKEVRHPMYGLLPFIFPSFDREQRQKFDQQTPQFEQEVNRNAEHLAVLASKGIAIPVFRENRAVFVRFRDAEFKKAVDLTNSLNALGYKVYVDYAPSPEKIQLRYDRTPREYMDLTGRLVNVNTLNQEGVTVYPRTITGVGDDLKVDPRTGRRVLDFIVDTDPVKAREFWETEAAKPYFKDATNELQLSSYPPFEDAIRNNGFLAATYFPVGVISGDPVGIASEEKPSRDSTIWDFRTGIKKEGVTPEINSTAQKFIIEAANFADYYGGGLLYSVVGPRGQFYGDLNRVLDRRQKQLLRNLLLGTGHDRFAPGSIVVITYTPVDPKLFKAVPVVSTVSDLQRLIAVLASGEVQDVDKIVELVEADLVQKMEVKLWQDKTRKDPNAFAFWNGLYQLHAQNQLRNVLRVLLLSLEETEANAEGFVAQLVEQLPPAHIQSLRAQVKRLRGRERAFALAQSRTQEDAKVLDHMYRYMGSLIMDKRYGAGLISADNSERAKANDLLNFFGRIGAARSQQSGDTSNAFKQSQLAFDWLTALQNGLKWQPRKLKAGSAAEAERVREGIRRRQTGAVKTGATEKTKSEVDYDYCELVPISTLVTSVSIQPDFPRYSRARSFLEDNRKFTFVPPSVWYIPYDTTNVLGTYRPKISTASQVLEGTQLAVFRQLDENQVLFALVSSAVDEYNRATPTKQPDVAYKWYRIFTMVEMYYYFTGYTSFGSLAARAKTQELSSAYSGNVRVEGGEIPVEGGEDTIHEAKKRFDSQTKNIRLAIDSLNRWTNRTYLGPDIGAQLDWLNQVILDYQQWYAAQRVRVLGERAQTDVTEIEVKLEPLVEYIQEVRQDTRTKAQLSQLISTLRQAQATTQGSGLRKSGKIAIFKTYNPVLFELTRNRYGAIRTGKTSLLTDELAVMALDTTGIYGTLLQIGAETGLQLKKGFWETPDDLLRYNLGYREAGEGDYKTMVWWFDEPGRFIPKFLKGRHFEPKVASDPFSGNDQTYGYQKKANYDDVKYIGQLWPLEIATPGIRRYFLSGLGNFPGYFNDAAVQKTRRANILGALTFFRQAYEFYVTTLREGYELSDTGLSSFDPYKVVSSKRYVVDTSVPIDLVHRRTDKATTEEKNYRRAIEACLGVIYEDIGAQEKQQKQEQIQNLIYNWNLDILRLKVEKIKVLPPDSSKKQVRKELNRLIRIYAKLQGTRLEINNSLFGSLSDADRTTQINQMEEWRAEALRKLLRLIEVYASKLSIASTFALIQRKMKQHEGYLYYTNPAVVDRLLERFIAARSTEEVEKQMPSFYRATHERRDSDPQSLLESDEVQIYQSSTWRRYLEQEELQSKELDLVLRAKTRIEDQVDPEIVFEENERLEKARRQRDIVRARVFREAEMRQEIQRAYVQERIASDYEAPPAPDDISDEPASLRDNPRRLKYRRAERPERPPRKSRRSKK